MPNGFRKTALTMYTTVSEQLRVSRENRHLGLAECAQQIAIQEKYLKALEESAYDAIPGELYIRSWIKKYAAFLGLDIERLMISYEKERAIRMKLKREGVSQRQLNKKTVWEALRARHIAFALALIVVLSYLSLSIYRSVRPPRVAFVPEQADFRTQENSIILKGRTEPGVVLAINQQQVALQDDGSFEQTVSLTEGLNTLTIEARKKHGFPFTTTVRIVKSSPPEIQ